MSEMSQTIERFEKWFKESGKGTCKNPNYGLVPTKTNTQIQHILPSWYIANPIYPAGRYQGD